MIEDKKPWHRNKSNYVNNVELWLFLSCFTPVVSAASSIITKSMFANI